MRMMSGGIARINQLAQQLTKDTRAKKLSVPRPYNALDDLRTSAVKLIEAYQNAQSKIGGGSLRMMKRNNGINPQGKMESLNDLVRTSRMDERVIRGMINRVTDHFVAAASVGKRVRPTPEGVQQALQAYETIRGVDWAIVNEWFDARKEQAANGKIVLFPDENAGAPRRFIDRIAMMWLQSENLCSPG